MSLEDLYQEVIVDHYKNPRNRCEIQGDCSSCSLNNPLCGDQVKVSLRLKEDKISEICFTGHGCSISQASSSIVCELCQHKSKKEAEEILQKFKLFMRSQIEEKDAEILKDALALSGVRKFSARIKCAFLAWEAVEKCLQEAIGADKGEIIA